jgi:lysophospholipase L1-like esterase
MKTVLCYGDSNTWGYLATGATDGERLGRWERWPGILQRELGDGVHVVEEGLNGRTTVFDVPEDPNRNGLAFLPVALETHAPVDVLLLFLGVNDMFLPYRITAWRVAHAVGALVDSARRSEWGPAGGPPAVIVMAPPPFGSLGEDEPWSPHGVEESRRFGAEFKRMATEHECDLVDLDGTAAFATPDGIHFDADGHRDIGRLMAERLGAVLGADT